MSSANLPHRRTATIDRQHCQIEALIEALESRFESHLHANRSLVSLLNSLAAHLQIHFEMEEEDCYFAGVIRRTPHLGSRLERLLQQHTLLLARAAELVDMARTAFTRRADTTELAARFHEFSDFLLEHERAEIDLLQEAYSQNLGMDGCIETSKKNLAPR